LKKLRVVGSSWELLKKSEENFHFKLSEMSVDELVFLEIRTHEGEIINDDNML
jgi:hypothetical protein